MKFDEANQRESIQRVFEEWIREDLLPDLRAAIARRRKRIPEETEGNLEAQFFQGLSGSLGRFELSFQDSGRMVDLRELIFQKRPIQPGNNFILDWVKKKGLSSFRKGVPGYPNGVPSNSKLTQEKQMERIASAIIRAKTEGDVYRPKGKWYNKTVFKAIDKLSKRISASQSEWVRGWTKEALEQGIRG